MGRYSCKLAGSRRNKRAQWLADAEAWRAASQPRAKRACFVIALIGGGYFRSVDHPIGGYLKDALVFENRSAADLYLTHSWMRRFPGHVVETRLEKIQANRDMHARVAGASP